MMKFGLLLLVMLNGLSSLAMNDDLKAQRGNYMVLFKEDPQPLTHKAQQLRPFDLGAALKRRIKKRFNHVLNGASMTLSKKEATALARNPGVALVEPMLYYKPQASETPWGLDRIDQRDLPLSNSFDRSITSYPVHVYVVDSGMRTTHLEIAQSMGTSHFDITGGSGDDCNGHGTHVASVIAGQTLGVTRSAVLHNVKVLTCDTNGESTATSGEVIAGLEWIMEHARLPAVVNLSLGSPGYSSAVNTAVKNLIDRGITVVTAAGNFDDDACAYSPAGYEAAITVGASTSADERAIFSNDGPCLDLFAPGEAIKGAAHDSDTATILRDGTSMAAAHMTGLVVDLLRDFPETCPNTVADALIAATSQDRLSNVTGPNRLLFKDYIPQVDTATCYSANNTVYDGYQLLEPCGFYYAAPGKHEGRLIVPEGADFDLALEHSQNGNWMEVKKGMKGVGSDETVLYTGPEGYYRWKISAVSGTGAYRFYWKKP